MKLKSTRRWRQQSHLSSALKGGSDASEDNGQFLLSVLFNSRINEFSDIFEACGFVRVHLSPTLDQINLSSY